MAIIMQKPFIATPKMTGKNGCKTSKDFQEPTLISITKSWKRLAKGVIPKFLNA